MNINQIAIRAIDKITNRIQKVRWYFIYREQRQQRAMTHEWFSKENS